MELYGPAGTVTWREHDPPCLLKPVTSLQTAQVPVSRAGPQGCPRCADRSGVTPPPNTSPQRIPERVLLPGDGSDTKHVILSCLLAGVYVAPPQAGSP